MSKKIGIIGSGSWGLALGKMLDENGHDVILWNRNEKSVKDFEKTKIRENYLKGVKFSETIKMSSNKEEVVKNKDIIIMAVPSSATRDVMEEIKIYIEDKQQIINVSKGFDGKTKQSLYDVIKSIVPKNDVFVLSGPSHAEEVAKKMITTVVIAGEDENKLQNLIDVFSNDYFRVYKTVDIVGVEIGSALKNIVAIAVGLIDGYGLGDNAIAGLMTRSMVEIMNIGKQLGANPKTFIGLSGFGDLIVTCSSKHSRNRRCGYLLGKGMKLEEIQKEIGMVIEGLDALSIAKKISDEKNIEVPIITELHNIIYNDVDVKEALKKLLSRRQGEE